MTDTKQSKASIEERTIQSIVKQFRGGEHKLAGQRASELVYESAKINDALLDKIKSEAPGIERYVSAPENPIEIVEDQGGNPLSTQPENTADATGATNVSTDKARKEQDAIDKRLAKGRERRVAKDGEQKTGGDDATKLNPSGSSAEGADKL